MDIRNSNNYSFRCNPRRYEEYLSLFGRSVLDNLRKKWNSDSNRRQNQNAHPPYQSQIPPLDPRASHWPRSKKVLTFLGEQPQIPSIPHLPPIACNVIPLKDIANNTIVDNEQPFDFDAIEKQLPPVPTTNELIKTVQQTGNSQTNEVAINRKLDRVENVSTYDILNPVIDENKARNTMYDFHNFEDDNKISTINPGEKTNVDNQFASTTPRVNWDDMFDTELLPVVTNPTFKVQQNTTVITAENVIDNVFPEGATDKKHKTDECKITKIKETKLKDVKKAKRKTQCNVSDVIPKKVKKISETKQPKNYFRKQKYTKTVNNWLDGVQLINKPQEEFTNKKDATINISNKIDQTISDKSKVVSNKKVIQAQLANKDGKMKFGKPKHKIETETNDDKTDKTMDKKAKPKFVTPIKSQVPVKEINYEVVIVDTINIQQHTDSLRSIEGKDIIAILVYSNGFSQLNKHHTEDTCEPEGFMVNIEEKFFYFKGIHHGLKEVIRTVLDNNTVICYEGKNLLIYLEEKFGLECNNLVVIDAKIGGSLLDPDNSPENFSDLQKLLSFTPQYTIATECILQKTAWYTILLDECGVKLTTLLKENGSWNVFVDIEMKLLPIIAEMERRGVTVDLQKLKSMEDMLLAKMKEVEQECYTAAGRTFQLNSAVQIRAIIYDELQLDTKCNVKIKETICKGAKSTSETMLRSLVSVHPLPKLILEYRHLHKAHATFLTGIAQQVKDGIVRPTWVQTAAATGRIASNNPNLQAIPKAPFNLVLFPDENNSGNQTLSIRSVYTSRAGYCLVAADFQHVECRVFAHCAADTALLNALKAGGDLFRALAAKWLNKPESDISSEDRERTKRIVYASLYGAGCRKLMDILGVSYEQTLSIITSFNNVVGTFPSLKSFGRSVVSRCEQNGGRLSTLCGRVRRFKNITSQDFQLKSQAERQAVNFIVQGSAADLCKIAMVRTSQRLRAHCPPLDGYLLLQIHDELVWEIRHEHVDTAAAIIKEVMESCGQHCGMTMTLPVTISTGSTWGDMAEYSPQPPLMQ